MAEDRQSELKQLGDNLRDTESHLQEECLLYVVTLQPEHLRIYWKEASDAQTRGRAFVRAQRLGAYPDSMHFLTDAFGDLNTLEAVEIRAMRLVLEAAGAAESTMPPEIAKHRLSAADRSLTAGEKQALACTIVSDPAYATLWGNVQVQLGEFHERRQQSCAA